MAIVIAVYADWAGIEQPIRFGHLHARRGAGREAFEFEYDAGALADRVLSTTQLDPRIALFPGRQHPERGRDTFGMFADASPDRWGRMLMQRRLERDKRAGAAARTARLHESDYLLGVHDAFRTGGLRFRLDDAGDFLDNRHDAAAPAFVQLRELETASLALERDEKNTAKKGDEWLRLLIAPGGSLGGARPKASVVDPDGRLWIAKFPSVRDEHDVAAWEQVLHALAHACGLNVPESSARRFAHDHHTFLVQRFDRTSEGRRIHFASAMTLTGRKDGDDAAAGVSYLELARVLIDHGANPREDLRELWSRIVFFMLVSNTDDHLRNHGFLLEPGRGWGLSPAFDMNPVPVSDGLQLNVSETDNALDLDLAREVAPYFRVAAKAAREIIESYRAIVSQWRTIARKLRVPAREQERMAESFRLAG
ncbi:MAG: HipA domain-containing protein [Usitatibacter sp.]